MVEPIKAGSAGSGVNGEGFDPLVVLLVDVEAQGVHAQEQLGALLVLDVEIVHPVHLQVLGDLQVLHHGLLSAT